MSSNWEDDAAAPWYDTDNEEVEEGVCPSPEEAGDIFVEQLLMLKYRGTFGAESVCVFEYLAAEPGAVGPAKELGCRLATGHFQKKIDDFTLFSGESERTYDVRVPKHDRLENDRVVTEIQLIPPHESAEQNPNVSRLHWSEFTCVWPASRRRFFFHESVFWFLTSGA